MTRKTKAERDADKAQALDTLRKWLPVGHEVCGIVTHVSRSGMQRRIKFLTVVDGAIYDISGHVSDVLGWRWIDGGVVVDGCGRDMVFRTVYLIGRLLYPQGFKVGGRGRNGDTSGWDDDGGYALKAR